MFYQKLLSTVAALILTVAVPVAGLAASNGSDSSDKKNERVLASLNISILIQDDLVSEVGNQLDMTREFIRSLPAGSRVMVGYITSGSLQVRQPFTTDLARASNSLRIPISSGSASPYNPYVEVIEALRHFNQGQGRNVVLLISDGLDTSHGFDSSSAGNTMDLLRAIKRANDRNVSVYTFYAPSVGLTSRSMIAASYGQSSLNRLADETGGKAFSQGSSFVTFSPYFKRLRAALNDQIARAY
ncbi:MAG: hypothetical protein ABI967_05740 [bacterium]